MRQVKGKQLLSANSASYWAVEAGYAQGKWDAGVGYHTVLATNTEQKQNEHNGSYKITKK